MNIYVGNLPIDFDETELTELFEEYGSVRNAKIIRDRNTRLSRGFGFVEMDDKAEAERAIKDWNNGSIDDYVIQVRESKPNTRNKRR